MSGTGGTAGSGAGGGAGSSAGGSAGISGMGGMGGSCVPTVWCRDGDEDRFGDPRTREVSCDPPGDKYIPIDTPRGCADCQDENADVNPGQMMCFPSPYAGGDVIATFSFDYNCDMVDEECNDPPHATDCMLDLSGGTPSCTGSGYLPQPTPVGTNPFCGSTRFQQCVVIDGPSGLVCVPMVSNMFNPILCR